MLSAMSYNKGYRCVYSLNIHKRARDKVPKKGHQPRNSFIGCMKSLPALRPRSQASLTSRQMSRKATLVNNLKTISSRLIRKEFADIVNLIFRHPPHSLFELSKLFGGG